jgi:cellobiose phosphorylase
LFGVKKVGDVVKINPALPKSITKASLTMRFDGVEFKVDIDNEGEGEWRLFHNSVRYETDVLKISPLNHNKKFVLKRV